MQPSLLGKMLYVNPLVILKHKLMYGSLCFHIFNILFFSCSFLTLNNCSECMQAVPNFLCQNCLYQEHQCFACGMLGSSDKSSSQEV